MGVGCQQHTLAALPRKRLSTHCMSGWVGSRTGLDGCGKNSPPQGFDLRTVHAVPSCYIDYVIPAHIYYINT